jgi:hypothetical protein
MHYATSLKATCLIPKEICNLLSRAMALEMTHPLTEMSTRHLPGGKGQLAHNADNLIAIYEVII